MSLIGPANQTPGLTQVFTLFNTSTPQIYADIDRTKAEMLGVPITRFFDTLATYMGSTFVNDFNILGRTYRVTAQADNPYPAVGRATSQNLRTRSTTDDMVPLGAVASFREITGPYRVPRYNLFPAAEVQGATLPGFSTGQAIAAMEKLAARPAHRASAMSGPRSRCRRRPRATRRRSRSASPWCSCSCCLRRNTRACCCRSRSSSSCRCACWRRSAACYGAAWTTTS